MLAMRLRSAAGCARARLAQASTLSCGGTTPARVRTVTSEAEAHMPVMTGIARWEVELPKPGIEALAKRFSFASAQDADRFVKQVGDFAMGNNHERVRTAPLDDGTVIVHVAGTDVEYDSDELIPDTPERGTSLGIRDIAIAALVDDLGAALQCKVAWS